MTTKPFLNVYALKAWNRHIPSWHERGGESHDITWERQ